MVKRMFCDSICRPGLPRMKSHLVIKLGISVLALGLALRLLFGKSSDFAPLYDDPVSEKFPNFSSLSDSTRVKETEKSEEICDLFNGEWIPYSGGPYYTNESCGFIDGHQNCMKNGRPDTGYLNWRWKPYGCEMHQLDSKRFLEKMRNKSWGFIGDSISRNHVQSLLCILSLVEQPVEVSHADDYKSITWIFPAYNFTLSRIWSPFLTKASIFEDMNGVSTSEIELHLDILDEAWIEPYSRFDYMIIAAGKWFVKTALYYENTTLLGCHFCPKRNLTELGFDFAMRKVMKRAFNFIVESNHKGVIFYRPSTPDHFEGGDWSTGGACNRKEPAKEGEFQLGELNRIIHDIGLEEFKNASRLASENRVDFRLFDMTALSLSRPDGHPGAYRFFQPFAKDKNATVINDCLHWCLPGPIDHWNQVLFEIVLHGVRK